MGAPFAGPNLTWSREPRRVELREGFHAALPYKGSMRTVRVTVLVGPGLLPSRFVDQSFTQYAAKVPGTTPP